MAMRKKKGVRQTVTGRIDLLHARLAWLSGKDKLLMKMYLNNSNTFRQMAALAGVNESTIARRIYKIVKRLLDGHYITVLRHSDEFSLIQIQIAQDYFVKGLSQNNIAKLRGCSRYSVRQTLLQIQAMNKRLSK